MIELEKKILKLERLSEALLKENKQLRNRIKNLEAMLKKNSRNSHKAPSSDKNKPNPKSLRERTGRKPGGQTGHPGSTLNRRKNPDKVVPHRLDVCPCCEGSLSGIVASQTQSRQVFDLPEHFKLECTEHQIEVKICPHCDSQVKASFPEGIDNHTQYGKRFRAFVIYLKEHQLLPYRRICEIIENVFDQKMSEGTVENFSKKCHENLKVFTEHLLEELIQEEVLHVDETGIKVCEKGHWLHVATTKERVHYAVHQKRGSEAMDAIGILPQFTGIATHDAWSSYFKYACQHSLCNAHILRELTAIEEQGFFWATLMKKWLIHQHQQRQKTGTKTDDALKEAHFIYEALVFIGEMEEGHDGPGRTLLKRLRNRQREILLFLENPRVAFDNNEAERAIRMMKVKQKISGCFRSFFGAERFCRIRSFIMTSHKQHHNIFQALQKVFENEDLDAILAVP